MTDTTTLMRWPDAAGLLGIETRKVLDLIVASKLESAGQTIYTSGAPLTHEGCGSHQTRPADVVRITEVDKPTAKFPTRADHRGLDHGIARVVRKALLTLQGEILPREVSSDSVPDGSLRLSAASVEYPQRSCAAPS